MKYWKAGIIFLLAFFLQCSLLNIISFWGYTPNLLLALVVVCTFIYGEEPYGILFGCLFGLIYDVCYGDIVGVTPIAFLLVALMVSIFRLDVNVENAINMIFVSIMAIPFYYVVNWGLLYLTGFEVSWIRMGEKLLFSGVYTFVCAFVLYLILLKGTIKHKNDRKLW